MSGKASEKYSGLKKKKMSQVGVEVKSIPRSKRFKSRCLEMESAYRVCLNPKLRVCDGDETRKVNLAY